MVFSLAFSRNEENLQQCVGNAYIWWISPSQGSVQNVNGTVFVNRLDQFYCSALAFCSACCINYLSRSTWHTIAQKKIAYAFCACRTEKRYLL